jgi:cell division protein FtsB
MLLIPKKVLWFFGLAVFLLIIFLPGWSKLQESRNRNSELESRIKHITRENFLLQEELRLIREDPVYQEKIARQKLGVVRKGEIPIKIISAEEKE